MISTRTGVLIAGFLMLYQCSLTSSFCSTDFLGQRDYPYRYFQTKTLYDTVRGSISNVDRPVGCTPKSIVMFLRHGSRHPGADEVDEYQELSNLTKMINATGNAELCKEDIEKIMKWENWHQPGLDKDLAVTGHAEMKGLSERYADVFPEIFSANTSYRFISSETRRTIQSAEAFKDGLFVTNRPRTEINNYLTQFADYCERYLVEIGENDTVIKDVDTFMEGPVIEEITDEFVRRLGIPRSEVSTKVVNIARKEGCAEEEWATGNSSAWCLAFSKEDFQAFEYGEDMDDYLVKSFEHDLNYRQSCGTKNFLLSALQNASLSDSASGHFLFSHSLELMSLLTEMKVIEDDGPFRSTDYPEKINRTFRASLYTPGSGNIAIILYECEGEMKIQMFLNENLVRMPLHSPEPDGLWNLESALQYFGYRNPEDCPFEQMCAYHVPATDNPSTVTTTTNSAAQISPSVISYSAAMIVMRGLFDFRYASK